MTIVKRGETGGATNIGLVDEGTQVLGLAIASVGILYALKIPLVYIYTALIIVLIILLAFYRHPPYRTGYDRDTVVSPAYGLVKDVNGEGDNIRIVILLGIQDPHVQYVPINSTVRAIEKEEHIQYKPIFFKDAENNMSITTEFLSDHGTVSVRQIAGYFPRRISNRMNVGEYVHAGEKLGMIKFGSRVDIVINDPNKKFKVNVSPGDYVHGSYTILGKYS